MAIIIFGSNGMLGKYVCKVLNKDAMIQPVTRKIVDLTDISATEEYIQKGVYPKDIIVNCAGVIPQRSNNTEDMVKVNTLFPLMLNKLPNQVIHISTDCVFSGKQMELRSELWDPDATSIYGTTKALGEPVDQTVIRTSIIGEGGGLLQWVLDNQFEKIKGYHHHFWNGITCLQLATIIKRIIDENLYWTGVRHIHSTDMASKFILLKYIEDIYDLCLEMECICPENIIPTYRILESIFDGIDWKIPSIPEQIKEQREWHEI